MILAGLIVAFFLLVVIAPSLLATNNPYHVNLADVLQAPSLHDLLGTDESGRDLYSRIIYGARESLLIGLGATGLAMFIAVILGVASGLSGGFVDGAINRGIEVLFSFPVMLLALLVVAIFGPSATTEIVAVGVGTAPGYARMIRGQVIAVKDSGYVEAARALGHPDGRVVRRQHLPQRDAPARGADDAGRRAGDRVGVRTRLRRPRHRAAVAGVGRAAERRAQLRHPGLVAGGVAGVGRSCCSRCR